MSDKLKELLELEFQRCKKLRRKIMFHNAKECTFSKVLKRIESVLTSTDATAIKEAIDELKTIKEDNNESI